MVHVGVGWVPARLGKGIDSTLAKLDPLLGWLAVDGYGFHEGYFNWPRYVREQAIAKHLSGYALRVFDQGLGRSLWFIEGADVTRLRETIATFPVPRQADLWGGVGLGCSYAAGVEPEVIRAVRTAGAAYLPQIAQGAAFAAKARARAGNPTAQTEMACEIFCGMSAEAAAAISDLTLKNLPTNEAQSAELPAYEVWRQRIQAQFTHEEKA
jgi:hypothetical protein